MRRKILVLALLFGLLTALVTVDFMWVKKGVFYEAVSNYLSIDKGSDRSIIVIDAGHGGFDGGAVSKDGTEEEDITLAIAKELQQIASEYPIEVVMTREDGSALSSIEAQSIIAKYQEGSEEYNEEGDGEEPKYANEDNAEKTIKEALKLTENDTENNSNYVSQKGYGFDGIKVTKREDLNARKKIIDKLQPIVAVSIHLNNFTSDSSVYGAQVFYPKDESGVAKNIMQVHGEKGESSSGEKFFYASSKQKRTDALAVEQPSRIFAESVQKSLETNISDGKDRKALAKNDILLFKKTLYPTILVECGFLSNYDELNRLKTAEYQRKLAESVWDGLNAILCLEKNEKIQIIDSTNKNG